MPGVIGIEDYYVRRPNHGHDQMIALGEGYYFVIIRSLQILAAGPLWKQLLSRNSRLVITSKVGVRGTYAEVEGVKGILPFYDPIKLGPPPTRFVRDINLIELVPSVGNGPSISVDVHVDSDSRLQALSGVINGSTFAKAISLDPRVGASAQAISVLATRVLEALLPDMREVVLSFSKDFNFGDPDFREGYRVFVATKDPDHPLSAIDASQLSVEKNTGRLKHRGRDLNNYSYLVLEIVCLPERGRSRAENSEWFVKMRDARKLAQNLAESVGAVDEKEKRKVMKECRSIIAQGMVLLEADRNYLQKEREKIRKAELATCAQLLWPEKKLSLKDIGTTRKAMGVKSGADLSREAEEYERTEREVEGRLRELLSHSD